MLSEFRGGAKYMNMAGPASVRPISLLLGSIGSRDLGMRIHM
jgi:hypothetical protein